jgi:hypothetical protein
MGRSRWPSHRCRIPFGRIPFALLRSHAAKALQRRRDVSDAAEQFIEVTVARLLQSGIVQHEAFDDELP